MFKSKTEKRPKTKKNTRKYNLSYKLAAILSLVMALVITSLIGIAFSPYDLTPHPDYTTIEHSPALLNSLQVAKADGVVIAIHGWEHENYSALTHKQAASDLHNAEVTFDKVGLHTTIFVCPYEVSGEAEPQNVDDDVRDAGLTMPFDKATLYEYTWEWRNMTSDTDPRYVDAINNIDGDNPQIIMLHAQDWDIFTQAFLNHYLAATKSRHLIVRMDDISFNTEPKVIQGMDELRKYPSVDEVMVAVIPAMPLDMTPTEANPAVFNIPVNRIMELYVLFFLVFAMFPLSFFVIWKLTAGIARRKYEKQLLETEIQYPEFLTIIVPAYNEKSSIARCIESLLKQDYKGAKEIIVVNDGSTDNTASIVSQYPVTLLNLKKNVGKASALNEGIKLASGDIIVFTDGDSNMCPDAISSMIRCFSAHPNADVVTGQVLINKPKKFNFITYFQMVEYHLDQEVVRYLQNLVGEIVVCPGPITAVKRHVCDKVPYTNDTILEDADFTATIRRQEFNIQLDTNAKVYTNAPETLKQWYKQRTRWWYGNLQVWHIHKKWAIKNPWMIYSYIGFVTSLCSLGMMLIMPYLIIQYGDFEGAVSKGLISLTIPVIANTVLTAIFFRHDKKLMIMLIPYMIVYPILKMFVLSYFYVRYVTRIGLNIQHGTRKMKVK